MTYPLTNTEVKQAKPREKEYNLADGNGLYLRFSLALTLCSVEFEDTPRW